MNLPLIDFWIDLSNWTSANLLAISSVINKPPSGVLLSTKDSKLL